MKPTKKSKGAIWPFSRLRQREGAVRDRWIVTLGGLSFAVSLGIILVSTQFGSLLNSIRPSDYQVGSVAERDVVVERDIVYVDEEATRLKREAAGKLVLPIFRINENITENILKRFEGFRRALSALLASEESVETVFLRLQVEYPGVLTRETLTELLEAQDPQEVLGAAEVYLEEIMTTGLVRLPEGDAALEGARELEVWRWREGNLEKETYAVGDVLTVEGLGAAMEARLEERPEAQVRLIGALMLPFVEENGFYDAEETEKRRRKAMNEVDPVQAKLVRDQVIVRKGDIITEKTAEQIRALGEYSTTVNMNTLASSILFVVLAYAFAGFALQERVIGMRLRRKHVLFLAVLLACYLLLAAILYSFFTPPAGLPFAVVLPTAAIAIFVALILSLRVGFVFSLVLGLLLLPIVRMELSSLLFAVLTGTAATAVVLRSERRIDLIRAGVLLSGLNILILVVFGLTGNANGGWALSAAGWGILNGLGCSMLSLGLLPILEHALNTASRFRLIELSDVNSPVLKRMLSLAPGTYTHSLSVANLAESACSAIGANALLARVGAYYHDIGKIEQAEYFIENQTAYNKHDELKPSLSAAVIKAHVKMGIEKARELDLPDEVMEIIAQHHGRGVIKYFYQRALENGQNGNVTSEDYSYPGVPPRSREAAVVMLADTVEAASRTLKKPTIAKLDKFVWDIVMDKFTSHELGESELTLRDLELIKKSFVQVLAGYFHSRIEYPKAKEAVR
ncbi:MAG: HDIG domain-containing protein [Spirochaetales bacterium]|nr:HDIG domain-containing protein [Spirochaetales bacterium]